MHKTLRVAPAMQAGLTTRMWTFEDTVEMIDESKRQKESNQPTHSYWNWIVRATFLLLAAILFLDISKIFVLPPSVVWPIVAVLALRLVFRKQIRDWTSN